MTAETFQADHRPTLELPQTYAAEARETLKLAWPMVLTQLASMAIGVTDIILIGELGPDALAAAALGLSLFYMPMMFGFGLSATLSPVVAQSIGADPGGLDPARRAAATSQALQADFRTALWAIALISIPSLAILVFAGPLLGVLGQKPHLAEMAVSYLSTLMFALPFMLFIGVMRNLFSALSRPRPALVITIVWIGLNALLNWIFIFGHLGMPALGIMGSGLATACATFLGAAAMALTVALHPATRGFAPFQNVLRADWGRIRQFAVLGMPVGLTLFFEGAIFNAAIWLVGMMGEAQLAGHQIAINVASVTFQIPLGVAFATTVRVGYAAGARDWGAARRASHVAMTLSFATMILTATLMWVYPYGLASLYLDLSAPDALAAAGFAAQYLAIAAIFQIVDGQQIAAAFSLRGLKDMRAPMWIAAIAYWAVAFPICVGLGFYTPLEGQGVWIGLAVGLVFAAVMMTWRFEWMIRRQAQG